MTPEEVTDLIRSRRAIFPNMYSDKPIPKEVIETILENANWAPTHKMTEPWRFKVFQGNSLQRLADYLGDWYLATTPEADFSDIKFKKAKEKPLQSNCVLAICMQRDPKESLPEWEELASVAAAVQNIWLTCTAYGIGCYWSSPGSILEADEFLGLQEGEKCYGLFYMGYYEGLEMKGKRTPVEEKVEWMK